MSEGREPTLADLFGVPTEIEFEGKTYPLRQANLLEQAKFGRWLERRALEAAARATDLPEDVQERLFRAVTRDIAAGVYEMNSAAGAEALATPVGRAKLLHLILSSEHPEVTEEVAARMLDREQRKIAAILATGGDPDDPKAGAVLAGLGLPSNFLSASSATPPSASPATRSAGSPPANSAGSSG